MAKTQEKQAPVNDSPVEQSNVPAVANKMTSVDDVFNREVNGLSPVKSITLKRVMTLPLVAMSHQRELLMRCTSEMYAKNLPTAGRTEGTGEATVIECTDLESGDKILLVCNAMMVGALKDAAPPLIGRCFAFKASTFKEGKKYLVVDVIEVEVEQ